VAEVNTKLNEGNVQAAADAAQAARTKSPEFDEAWVAWAATELRAGRKASALEGLRRAIELNPANKRQLPRNRNFEPLFADPEFKKLVGL
jgi:Flp pilus assembly protein TadD